MKYINKWDWYDEDGFVSYGMIQEFGDRETALFNMECLAECPYAEHIEFIEEEEFEDLFDTDENYF